MVSTIIFYKTSIIWFFPTFPPSPKSIISQTPSLGYQALHDINPAYLPMYALSSLNSLTVRHAVPSTWDLRTCSAFPNRRKLWMLSRRVSTNSWPPPSQCLSCWTASSLSNLSPCLSCYLLSFQTCQSAGP